MTGTRATEDRHHLSDDRVREEVERSERANRAADLATDRYAEQERQRRRESLEELLGRDQSA